MATIEEESRAALADLAQIIRRGREIMRQAIRVAASSGVTITEISKATGLARTTIYRIITEPAEGVSPCDTLSHGATTSGNS
jgi:DNA invertase Pin-like site-specific DNA recombinase